MNMLKELSEDVKNLYFKTGIKDIEDTYIFVAEAQTENVSDEEVLQWIDKGLGVRLSDPKTYQALQSLKSIDMNELVNKFNYWLVQHSEFGAAKKGDIFTPYIGYYVIFSKLIGNPSAGLLLKPFEQIISFFGNPEVIAQVGEGMTSPDEFTVFHDMMKMQESLLKHKRVSEIKPSGRTPVEEQGTETKQDQKRNLYSDLYNWFSEDFRKAAVDMGYSDFASQMEKGGLLGNIGALSDYFEKAGMTSDVFVIEPNMIYQDLLSEIVKFIVKPANLNRYLRPENHIEAYREIKEYIMKTLGHVSREHLVGVRKEREKARNIAPETKKGYYEAEPIEGPEVEVSSQQWMDGQVLALTSHVLKELYYKFNL